VLEDGIEHGGIASTISELFRDHDLTIPVHSIGVPLKFFDHGKRNEILAEIGISVQSITRSLVGWSSLSADSPSILEEMQLPQDGNSSEQRAH